MTARIYRVDSIHCAGCESAIRQALGSIDGIADVQPDHRTSDVWVRFDDSKLSAGAVAAALGNAGFPVHSSRPSEDGARDPERQVLKAAVGPADGASQEAPREDGDGSGRYAVLVVAVVVVALAGYIGYVLYPRFNLPAAQGAGLLALAAAAGFASFFSPCSFPLLLGLLGRQAVAQTSRREAARPLMFGGALASGAGIFLLIAGLIIALGGQALFAGVTFTSPAGITIRSIVGGLLVLLGLMQTGILPLSLHAVSDLALPLTRWQARLRRERPVAGFAVFGFAYVLAGFG
ncbi:MAG: heavy-metal-associated domain-containing protein [Acidobacteriota bacterium]|nr:heavy-metal-associated domain-containing protein [Acidobacteriota bacterium]